MTYYNIEKTIKKGLPYTFRCRVHGKYDEEFYGTSPNDIDKEYTDLTDYNGFNYTTERKVLVNVSQVNDPTISDDGVVSNFAAAKYVYCSDSTIVFTSPWRLTVKFTTGSSVTSATNNVVGCNVDTHGIRLGWGTDGLFFFLVSDPVNGGWITTTEQKGTYVVQPNTTYWYRIGWDGSNYYGQYSLDGTTFTNDISYASTTTPTYNTYPFRLGNNGASNSYPMTGSIDLKECKMETPSQFFPDAWSTIWSGIQSTQAVVYDFSNTVLPWKWDYKDKLQISRYILDASNQTKTYYGNSINGTINGTLTITRAYTPRISGFSNKNFLTVPTAFLPESSAWEIVWKVKTGSSVATQQYLFGSSTGFFNTVGGELMASGKFGVGISTNGTSWDVGWMGGATVVTANTWYWLKISFTGTEYKVELSTDGENWNLENSITSSTPIYQNASTSIIYLGTMGDKRKVWGGSLDLQDSYIEVDGQEIWRGVKKETVPSMSYGKTVGSTNNVYVINGNESLSAESTSITRTTNATNPRFLGTVARVQ
jgi:hypothetical protein